MSSSEDISHSWVRISHGLNKLVTNLNNNEQETSEVQFEEYALRLKASDFASRSKAKAKPQKREPAGSSRRTIPIGERIWTDVEPGEYSISDYEVSKKLIHLLVMEVYIEKMMERYNSVESKTIFRNISCIVIIGLTTSGRKAWQEEEETRKDTNIVLIHQEQSCTSELFKAIQDAILFILHYRTMSYSERPLPVHFSCRMCNQFAFHHQFGIDTGRSKFEQQTDSIVSACGSHGQKP